MFAGEINPGSIAITREILTSPTEDFDTAIFSGALLDADGNANYTIAVNGVDQDVTAPITILDGDIVTVTDLTGIDGVDTLRNIERLQFTDQALVINGANNTPAGQLTIDDTTPAEGQLLTVSGFFDDPLTAANERTVTDADNIDGQITGPITYFWQQEVRPGVWEDIIIEDEAPEAIRATGLTFTPGDLQVGNALRVRAVYKDANGVLETVFSAATAAVAGVNDAPVGVLLINDTTPTETQALTAIPQFSDADGLTTAVFSYQWQQANVTGVGGGATGFTAIAGATLAQFTPGPAQVNFELRVVVTYTDDQGFPNTVTSAATTVTGDFIPANGAAQTLTGTEGQDIILGGGGADNISGLGENDLLDGGAGADNIQGGAGNDTIIGGTGGDQLSGQGGDDIFNYAFGDGADTVDGGADTDRLNIAGTLANNTLGVVFNGTSLTNFAGGTLANVEAVTADLLGNGATGDTLTYAGTLAANGVTVNLSTGTASGFTSIAGIENVTGGAGADRLTGNANANTLVGGASDDRFVATINDGNDNYTGNAGSDTYDLSGTTAGATVNAASSTSAETGTDTLGAIENVIGSQGDDSITFNGGVNIIDGQGGNDVINSGGGNDNVSGGAGNDTITAGAGNDTINGSDGNDTLIGGTGLDIMTGGLGADTFDFNAPNESGVGIGNDDLITDFELSGVAGGDLIDLSTLDANGGVAGNQAFTFIGTAAFTAGAAGAGQLRYVQSGGDTFIQGNTNNNAGNIEFELRLTGLHALSGVAGEDFIF